MLYATTNKDEPFVDLWDDIPIYDPIHQCWHVDHKKPHKGSYIGTIDMEDVPQGLTFENSPIKIELKIKEK